MEIEARVDDAWRIYETETTRYTPVGEILPALLAEAHLTLHRSPEQEEARAIRALVSLYHLHQVFSRRVGERSLSRTAADRAFTMADEAGDPVLIAASAWNLCGILTNSGDVVDSLELARSTIDACRPGDEAGRDHLSAYGPLHLAGVIAAVRAGYAPTAWDLLREAERIASRMGLDGNDWHTSFGPCNVAMHGVHLAAEEGDPAEALRLADSVDVNSSLPLERRTRYMLEVMNSNRMVRDDYGTLFMLQQIRQHSPEEIQFFPLARAAVSDLLKRERPAYRRALRDLATHVGVLN
ncbi:MAG: helix-turn-helix domain-containing protein [Carbonactinosporaceae bacterium]